MSIYRRRYDEGRINLIKYNSIEREKENDLYFVTDANEKSISFFINDHTDYVILSIINFWKKNYISAYTCDKLIDKVEGYYFAYEEGLIDCIQLYSKLNKEIMEDYFNIQQNNYYIGVYKKRDKVDLY